MSATTTAAGIELEYATYGDPADPPLLLVCGYLAQLITWPHEFCEGLAARGRFVIAYDNRDCGLSTKLADQTVDLAAINAAAAAGDLERVRALAPYTLADMAGDGVGLLDALGIDRAHVLGASMGGMIAQEMAIHHPDRVRSLISVMSTTGEPGYGESTPEAHAVIRGARPTTREAAIAFGERTLVWHSRRWPGLELERRLAAESFDRDHSPGIAERQLAAMLASGSRADGLRALRVPTLVIHGRDDTLIGPSGGERTAELVPGARLLMLDDMGHDRPEPLWPVLWDAIVAHTDAAE
jgi:pimeloyl-ACP methyl ester carboxylesterase